MGDFVMKLNKEGKLKLRESIKQQLENVPEGQRIHLDKKLLEELLFDTYNEEFEMGCALDGKKVPVKYLVWSGPFLSKLDLSEVSFDDVLWEVRDFEPETYFVQGTTNHYAESGVEAIDLSNTNAKIDFSKSFARKYADDSGGVILELFLSKCDFTNTDLSNNLIDYDFCVSDCDLSSTGLKIDLESESQIRLYCSNLSNLDFSAYTVDEHFFGTEWDVGKPCANECDLSNTGLRVKTTPVSAKEFAIYKSMDTMTAEQQQKAIDDKFATLYENNVFECMLLLGDSIKVGNLVGCYVNDKPILSKEQRQAMAKEKKEEYEKMKADLITSATQSIEQQVSGFTKKYKI